MGETSTDLFMQEVQVDMAITIGSLIREDDVDIADSRELVSNILRWAAEFTARYKNDIENEILDYLLEVDRYAVNKFVESYGTELNK